MHFHAAVSMAVFEQLWRHAHWRGPLVLMFTAMGQTTGAFMTSGAAWHFDSHTPCGALVTFHNGVADLCDLVTRNALAAGKQVTCAVIWRGPSA